MPHEVKVKTVGFSALGNNATYYVVSYRFTGELHTGSREASCVYRREGSRWVKDDAAAWALKRSTGPRPRVD